MHICMVHGSSGRCLSGFPDKQLVVDGTIVDYTSQKYETIHDHMIAGGNLVGSSSFYLCTVQLFFPD